ncbi:dTDP-4-dehydrorhamnose 3,5-epimerase [uncultured Draconibacterium sp.]|uniref:dTDP-4-dehydrorhamnose 3,5-epimerase n=1 Tax=uncultured Draconibacterium sp. TaxID=1573823 RepID=UPI0029C93DE8|nr:dTDP-4-dehydrorhamnose 3,5-epimerase [uncultured Draconibacterium sp.]
MIFAETELKGAFLINIEQLEDERGFFARSWCIKEMKKHGINGKIVQTNISYNKKKGTLRGMHFQKSPFEEAKLIRCTRGSIFDVIVDLRRDSPTYLHWLGVELTDDNYKMLYVPENFAHGFITLNDNTEVLYQMFEFYIPECASGIRWNDPALNISWPEDISIISKKDMHYPDYKIDNGN